MPHWASRAQLKPWWQKLQPLLEAVVRQGGSSDCFTLFFNLREGEYNVSD
jgi:hypothetical protein